MRSKKAAVPATIDGKVILVREPAPALAHRVRGSALGVLDDLVAAHAPASVEVVDGQQFYEVADEGDEEEW